MESIFLARRIRPGVFEATTFERVYEDCRATGLRGLELASAVASEFQALGIEVLDGG